jgi:hypothetical protein
MCWPIIATSSSPMKGGLRDLQHPVERDHPGSLDHLADVAAGHVRQHHERL